MTFFGIVGLAIAAVLGAIAALFRKGGIYNPTVPESEPVAPRETPVKSLQESPLPISIPSMPKTTVAEFCLAISEYEGGPGDANHKNCNPGNARYNPSGYLPMYGVVKKSPNGFAVFKDWNTGMLYLNNMLRGMIHNHPNETILQFMSHYAPTSDGNDPLKYANFIAARLGTTSGFLMKNLV